MVDLALNTVPATLEIGAGPHGQRISVGGKELYVANVTDGAVSVLDPAGLNELDRISVGTVSVHVGFTPDGSSVYVSLREEDKVAVNDPATRQVIAKVDVGDGAIQVFSTPDSRFIYVANQGTEKDPGETASVIEAATITSVATIRIGPGAHGIAISPDGALAFISNIFDGTVSVIDTKTNAVVANFAVGEGPTGSPIFQHVRSRRRNVRPHRRVNIRTERVACQSPCTEVADVPLRLSTRSFSYVVD